MPSMTASKSNLRDKVSELLSIADIRLDGDRPWDIQVYNDDFFRRVLSQGSIGLGESYMDGWWDAQQLDEFFSRLLGAQLDQYADVKNWGLEILKSRLFNFQSVNKAYKNSQHHYDIGNDIYRYMLDDRMIYSCGYWRDAGDLNQAQENKLDLACRKLNLKKGDRLLDVGCGWGGTAKFAAQNYGSDVVGVTVSKDQVEKGKKANEGLPVDIRFQDFRSLSEKFDKIVSIGMFEHVGYKNYRTFFEKVRENLKEDGLFLLHTIGGNRSVSSIDPWIGKYIFPNAMLPSIKQIGEASDGLFVMEDWHNFGPYYDNTLMSWFENFNNNWDELKDNYSDRFYRMWKYYLLACAGSFRARKNQLWQIVFSPKGIKGGYKVIT